MIAVARKYERRGDLRLVPRTRLTGLDEVEFEATLQSGRKVYVCAVGEYVPAEIPEWGYVAGAHFDRLHVDIYSWDEELSLLTPGRDYTAKDAESLEEVAKDRLKELYE